MAGATRGRIPDPSALKVLKGTDRPDRMNPSEPQPPIVELGTRAPRWIRDKQARRYWAELVPILSRARMLALTDTTALALLAKAYGRWRQYEDFIEKNGETYETGRVATKALDDGEVLRTASPMLRPRPEVAMRDKAEDRLITLLREFGMTPAARTRVTALPEFVEDPTERLLNGRRGA